MNAGQNDNLQWWWRGFDSSRGRWFAVGWRGNEREKEAKNKRNESCHDPTQAMTGA